MSAHQHRGECVVRSGDGAIRLVCGRVEKLIVGAGSTAYRVRQTRDALAKDHPDYVPLSLALDLLITSTARANAIKAGDYVKLSDRRGRGVEWKVVSVSDDIRPVAVVEEAPDFPGMPPARKRYYVSDLVKVTGK